MNTMIDERRIEVSRLRAATARIVAAMGSDAAETGLVADHLVGSNLVGHDSHGVGMLPAYVRMLREGNLVPNQTLVTVTDAGSVLVFDARRGFGAHMAHEATARAIERARQTGVCALSLRNSAHIGRIGTYGEQAAAAGMAFIAYVNVADHQPIAAPYGCGEPKLGTNPFVTVVPAPGGPVVLDMATTTIAHGKARIARNQGMAVPEGCLIDADGVSTTDPVPMIDRKEGALRTFGLHKGSGLAIMCEIMAGAVAGGQRADEPMRDSIMNSMFAVVIDLAAFGGAAAVGDGVAATRAHVTSARLAPGFETIQLPGDKERAASAGRMRDGIPVDRLTLEQITEAAASLGISASDCAALF
jgi:uncharacterized oxidoreductase